MTSRSWFETSCEGEGPLLILLLRPQVLPCLSVRLGPPSCPIVVRALRTDIWLAALGVRADDPISYTQQSLERVP